MTKQLSIYNTRIIIDNRHTVIFNALSRETVIIKDKILKDWSQVLKNAECNPSLHDRFLKTGIIRDGKNDEVNILKQRIREGINNENEFILHINPTLDCNFRCWYCYENHEIESKMKDEILFGLLHLITNILQQDRIKIIHIGFFGGEPLLRFEDIVKPIIQHTLSECRRLGKDYSINFTTNGYLLEESIIKWLSQYNCGFQITLDGGKEEHDKTRFLKGGKGSYNQIIRNIKCILEHRLKVIVRVNYTTRNISTISEIYNSFKNIIPFTNGNLSFDFQRVWQERGNTGDSTEERIMQIRREFIEAGTSVHSNYLPHDVRFPCYGDKKNYLLVNYNGDLFRCTARDFSKENRVGRLSSDGIPEYDMEKLNARLKTFRPICMKCRIAPICGGSCTQKSYERPKGDECVLGYSEADKDRAVIDVLDWTVTRIVNSETTII